MALRLSDLQVALDDERHLGFGYAGSRYLSASEKEDLDAVVLTVANEIGLDREELFVWANSKYGRWLCDSVQGAAPVRQRVQMCLSRDIVDELKSEVVDANIDLRVGQIWRDDCGSKYRIARLEGEWVYVVHPKAPKKTKAFNEIPRSWFGRPGWTLLEDAPVAPA